MDNNDLFELMKANGFTDRQIKRVFDHSVKMGVTLKFMLAELSSSFPKVIKMHLITLCIVGSIIILNYMTIDPDEIIELGIAYFIACVFIEASSPVLISYKAYQMRKKEFFYGHNK